MMDICLCQTNNFLCLFFLRCPSELGLTSTSSVKVEEVEEGAEPSEFMKSLGQQDTKAYDCMLQGASSPATENHLAKKLINACFCLVC